MSPNKSPKIIKYCLITSTTAIVLILISLIPISKNAFYWNKCLKKLTNGLIRRDETKKLGQSIKRSIAVAVCNGAVYEPKF